jgi:hypothetical protein
MVVALRRIVHVRSIPRENSSSKVASSGGRSHAAAHVVPGEGGQVPKVEDERVAQGDRLGEPAPGRETRRSDRCAPTRRSAGPRSSRPCDGDSFRSRRSSLPNPRGPWWRLDCSRTMPCATG